MLLTYLGPGPIDLPTLGLYAIATGASIDVADDRVDGLLVAGTTVVDGVLVPADPPIWVVADPTTTTSAAASAGDSENSKEN